MAETCILVPAIVFFWFPSNFPGTYSATGIDSGEWRVFLGAITVMGLYWADIAVWRVSGWPLIWQVIVTAGLVVASLLVVVMSLPPEGSPLQIDRADWFWLLALLLPGIALRRVVAGRIWFFTWLDFWLLALLLLSIFSTRVAPYPSRGLGMLMRPLLGMALVIHFIEMAQIDQQLRGVLRIMLGLSLLVGVMGLVSTQWNDKSAAFERIIELIPEFDRILLPYAMNPNEIGGALAWVVPLAAALMVYPWGRARILWQSLSAMVFVIGLLALFLGQSRFALAGVLLALGIVVPLIVPRPWRWGMVALVVVLVLLEGAVLFNLVGGSGETDDSFGLTSRDAGTSMQRLDIWRASLDIIRTYPLTGVGMNRFRYGPVAEDFPVVGFDIPDPDQPDRQLRPRPPHAHNEFLQFGTDFGVPGLIVFLGIYGTLGFMSIRCWHNGDAAARVIVVGAMAGLVAHAVYGLGDAIPIWDRFGFIFWLLVGLVGGQYAALSNENEIRKL